MNCWDVFATRGHAASRFNREVPVVRTGFRFPVSAVVIIALIPILTGCWPDREKTLSDCEKESDRFFTVFRADDPDNPRSQYIIGCMGAKGYDFAVAPKNCDNRYPLSTQAACYVPNDWQGWIVDQLQHMQESK